MAKNTKRDVSRKTARSRARLTLVPTLPSVPAPTERIVVPTSDRHGAPLPAWRVARWHLLNAALLLTEEFRRERTRDAKRASDFDLAAAIVQQVYAVLDPAFYAERWHGRQITPIEIERESLRFMARFSAFARNREKTYAVSRLLDRLPSTIEEARKGFPDHPKADEFDKDGATNLARWGLALFSSQGHPDAARVLKRWGIDGAGEVLGSTKFADDVANLAAEVRHLFSLTARELDEPFNRALLRRMCKLLRINDPFEGINKRRRRRERAKK